MTIRNDSKEPVTVFYQASLLLRATGNGPTASWCIRKQGEHPDPVGLYRDPPAANDVRSLPFHGEMGINWIPFLGLEVGDTHGMYVGVQWSAGWMYQEDVSVTTTMVEANGYGNGEEFSFSVPAGETFVVPPAFIGAYRGDLDDAGNDLKKYLWNYGMPEILRKDETYPKVQWNGYHATMGAQTPRSRWDLWIDAIAPLGFEEAMHDTGWYGGNGPCSVRWPQGMKVAADKAKAKGLRMGLYWPNPFTYAEVKRLFDDYGAAIWRSDFCPNDYKVYDSTRKSYEILRPSPEGRACV